MKTKRQLERLENKVYSRGHCNRERKYTKMQKISSKGLLQDFEEEYCVNDQDEPQWLDDDFQHITDPFQDAEKLDISVLEKNADQESSPETEEFSAYYPAAEDVRLPQEPFWKLMDICEKFCWDLSNKLTSLGVCLLF